MKTRVLLVIEGIPPHAWGTVVVEDLLGKSCAVDEIAPETKVRSDLSLFNLTAWTSELEAIPMARRLAVPEPLLGGGARPTPDRATAAAVRDTGEINTLHYRVLIHLVRVEEEAGGSLVQEQGPFSRGPEGSRDLGDEGSDGGGGGGRGAKPQRVLRNLAWTRGVLDRRRGPGGGDGAALLIGGPAVLAAAPAPEKAWALPRVNSPAPLTVQTSHVGTTLGQAVSGKVAAPLAERTAFGQRDKEERTAFGQRDKEEKEKAKKGKGPVVVEELVPLGTGHVAVLEPIETEAGHAADQVQWEDAPDSLPGADPEPVVPVAAGSGASASIGTRWIHPHRSLRWSPQSDR
jgi:hypothetical protein